MFLTLDFFSSLWMLILLSFDC